MGVSSPSVVRWETPILITMHFRGKDMPNWACNLFGRLIVPGPRELDTIRQAQQPMTDGNGKPRDRLLCGFPPGGSHSPGGRPIDPMRFSNRWGRGRVR